MMACGIMSTPPPPSPRPCPYPRPHPRLFVSFRLRGNASTAKQDGTRQSAYQAKMHVATAARKVKAADACAGCPGHERLFALLHTVEGVLAELKEKEATAAAGQAGGS